MVVTNTGVNEVIELAKTTLLRLKVRMSQVEPSNPIRRDWALAITKQEEVLHRLRDIKEGGSSV